MEKAFIDYNIQPEVINSFIEKRSQDIFLFLNLNLGTEMINSIFHDSNVDLHNVIVTIGNL